MTDFSFFFPYLSLSLCLSLSCKIQMNRVTRELRLTNWMATGDRKDDEEDEQKKKNFWQAWKVSLNSMGEDFWFERTCPHLHKLSLYFRPFSQSQGGGDS